MYHVVTRWTFSFSLILLLGALIYPGELLSLLGESYEDGSQILMIIALSQFFGSWMGTSGQVLLMHGHHRLHTTQLWAFGLVNLILNLLLVPRLGIVDAAAAMFLGFVGNTVAQVVEMWYLEGLIPLSRLSQADRRRHHQCWGNVTPA